MIKVLCTKLDRDLDYVEQSYVIAVTGDHDLEKLAGYFGNWFFQIIQRDKSLLDTEKKVSEILGVIHLDRKKQ
ncbi:MAG: hypothetical protein AB2766_11525 [Candidatus Thiodiazotropha endolucinida]